MGKTIDEILTIDAIEDLLDQVDEYPFQAEGEREARRRVLEMIRDNYPFESEGVTDDMRLILSDFAAFIGSSLPVGSQFILSGTFYELLSMALLTTYKKGGRDARDDRG